MHHITEVQALALQHAFELVQNRGGLGRGIAVGRKGILRCFRVVQVGEQTADEQQFGLRRHRHRQGNREVRVGQGDAFDLVGLGGEGGGGHEKSCEQSYGFHRLVL